MKISYDIPCVVATHNRNTAILVDREDDNILYIPLVGEAGFAVERMPVKEFSEHYNVLADYPAARAAQLYAGYAISLGATEEVMGYLGRIVKLHPKEVEMATAKKVAAKTAAEKPVKTTKAAAEPKAPAKKAAAKAAEPKAAAKTIKALAKAAGEPKAPRDSAANMFRELIMAGELTDDKIFEKVQKKFGLEDKSRSHVGWYRNNLIRQGKNPPPAKQGKK